MNLKKLINLSQYKEIQKSQYDPAMVIKFSTTTYFSR